MLGALALAVVVASCSGGDDESAESTTTEVTTAPTTDATVDSDDTTTTTVAAVPLDDLVTDGSPLSGLPVEDESAANRPALAVKIDNHPSARPQSGLDLADIVFEARVEGITRFLAVFHTNAPDAIGPVRSSRTSDFDLLRGLDTPLYASSGGNDYVANALRSLDIYSVTAMSRTEYYRNGSRPAPHNLYTNAGDLFALAPVDATPPSPWFDYRVPSATPNATGRALREAVTITYRGGPLVTHTWDDALSGWLRTQDGQPHTNADGEQLAPENVVIMVSDYVTSPADAISPELVSVGSGQLFVLTNGLVIEGTWSRESATDKPVLVDSAGNAITLTPGSTWVLFPESGDVRLPTS
jgi:hypothetical protein